jgi:hypothetical protein
MAELAVLQKNIADTVPIIELRGHHINDLYRKGSFTLQMLQYPVRIVAGFDTFCREKCPGLQTCPQDEIWMEGDRKIAQMYGFDIGKVYFPNDFRLKMESITPEQKREADDLFRAYFPLV